MPNGGQHDTRVATRAACLAVNKAATASYRDLQPPDFSASATSSDTIKLAMAAPVPDADTYDIQRSMNGISWATIDTLVTAAQLAEYLDGSKTAEETYYYRGRSVNPHGKSAWGALKSAKTTAASKAVAGRTTITGTGFGPAPNVVLNRYLTGVEGGSVPDAPDTAIGEVGSFAPSTDRPLISANGSVGVGAVVPGTQTAAGKLEYQHPTEVRRFRIYYEESVPQGKFVPGWKTTPALRTFANASGMKNLWLLQHAAAAPAGAGTDYAIASCTTYGERILAGNNVNHTAAPYWWSGSKATYDKHWDWDGWNAFDVVNGCDLAAPTTGAANHRMTFTSAITDATLKPTGTEIQTWSNPGFEGASTDADAFYKLFKLNAYARVQFNDIQIAFRNFYLAVESADNAGDYAQMAFLGNASTLEACTKRKPKVADRWTDTEVTIPVSSEEAAEFTHAFVQRADGTVVSKKVNESGKTGTVSWSATALENGGEITLTDEQMRLAERAQPYTKQWVMGDDARVDGVAVSESALGLAPSANIWELIDGSIVTSDGNPRHGFSTKHYRFVGRSELFRPVSFVGLPAGSGEKLTLSYYLYPKSRVYAGVTFLGDNIAPGFIYTEERGRGELVDVEKDGVVLNTGWLTYIAATGQVTLDMAQVKFADIAGSTIRGQVSGATMTVAANAVFSTGTSTKLYRIRQHASATPAPGIGFTYSVLSNGQQFAMVDDATGTRVNQATDMRYTSPSPMGTPEQYHLFEIVIDLSKPTVSGVGAGEAHFILDGKVITSWTDLNTNHNNPDHGLIPQHIGLETPGMYDVHSQQDFGVGMDAGEYVIDNDNQTWFLTDSPTFSSSTKLERCYIKDWDAANGRCKLQLYQGALTSVSGSYLHLRRNAEIIIEGIAL